MATLFNDFIRSPNATITVLANHKTYGMARGLGLEQGLRRDVCKAVLVDSVTVYAVLVDSVTVYAVLVDSVTVYAVLVDSVTVYAPAARTALFMFH